MDRERISRRECLTRGAGAVAAAATAALGGYALWDPRGDVGLTSDRRSRHAGTARVRNFFAGVDFPASGPRISVATGDAGDIGRLVDAAVGGLDPARGMRRFVQPGDVVLIKPNVGFDRPAYLGATTHPEVLRGVIRLCRAAGAREIIVTDNPIESPTACFAKSGIAPVVQAEGARLLVPREERFRPLAIGEVGPASPAGRGPGARRTLLDGWPVFNEPLERATKLIGIAPVKDHNLCSASMILKNWYGLLGGRRNQLHQAIHEVIGALGLVFSPTLVIADATRVMMYNGPTGGRLTDVKPGGLLGRPAVVAAVDPIACDAWCYENLLGRDPTRLSYLEQAHDAVRAEIATGAQRFGERDWRAHEARGLLVRESLLAPAGAGIPSRERR